MPEGISINAKLIAALAAVYIVWGSTYLGIAIALESLPPFLMAGVRNSLAGLILLGTVIVTTGEKPRLANWPLATLLGALLLLCGNGGVVWAQQYVPSGIAALLVGSAPFWFVLLSWLALKGPRPRPIVVAGLLLGFAGLTTLVWPGLVGARHGINPIGAIAVTFAALCWSIGSIVSGRIHTHGSPVMMASMQMLTGGLLLLLAALPNGDYANFDIARVTARSLWATLYLIVFGSLLGYSAYVYVLRNARPAVAATYAYVNPLVAVFVGWWLNNEVVTRRTAVAGCLIIGAVIMISLKRKDPPALDPVPQEA